MIHTDLLQGLVGRERSVRAVSHSLHLAVSQDTPPAAGAIHITCADETEHECVAAFQHGFVQYLLPSLKFSQPAAARLANLGARYEWGAIRLAEDHFATAVSQQRYKLLLVKVNAHVAVNDQGDYGWLQRYELASPCCGALHVLLEGGHQPWVESLREAFQSEGKDRIGALLDERLVEKGHRALYAAIVSARLQARAIILDIQDYQPVSPTLYLVVPCVTINRPGPDTEIVVGYYAADTREAPLDALYTGLGDDPRSYDLTREHGVVRVEDEHVAALRPARDHRKIALARWKHHGKTAPRGLKDPRLDRIRQDVAENKHHHHHHGRMLLQALLLVMAEAAPIPAAVLLFGLGASGIHHAFRVHHMTGQAAADDAHAKQMLKEVHDRVDHLDPEQAQRALDVLLKEVG